MNGPAALLLLIGLTTQAETTLRNWYNDPYFQIRNALPACPVPAGPYTTEAEMKQQAHWRTERGTSCWLAGKCKRANAYLYDAEIAADLKQRFAASKQFRHATLWVTVQRHFVYVEGCTADRQSLRGLEAFVKRTPDVELVSINTMPGVYGKPGYGVLPPTKALDP
ncbi:BON domain-containing protein [Chitinimonas naiadis]